MLLSVNSIHLHYAEFGPKTGLPLLCVHGGFGLDSSYFWPALRDLSDDFRLILLDLRGCGQGDQIPGDQFLFPNIVEDLEQVRRALQIDRWMLLGHSGGGLATAHYIGAHPERVSGWVLVGAFPDIPFAAPQWLGMARTLNDPAINAGFASFMRGITTDAEYRAACLGIAPLFFADPRAADLAIFTQVEYRVAPYNGAFANYESVECGPIVRNFRGPTLVLHGDHDYRVPLAEAQKWPSILPHAVFRVLPGTGHFPFLEAPRDFCAAIRAWWANV